MPFRAAIAKAHALPVRLTCKDNRMIARRSPSNLPISCSAIWNAEEKSLMKPPRGNNISTNLIERVL